MQPFINVINIYITKDIGLAYFFIISFWFRFLSLTNEFSFLPITFGTNAGMSGLGVMRVLFKVQ